MPDIRFSGKGKNRLARGFLDSQLLKNTRGDFWSPLVSSELVFYILNPSKKSRIPDESLGGTAGSKGSCFASRFFPRIGAFSSIGMVKV
ncbi:hypothetical protein HY224_01870 [Candidatus Uhrbacteria bacterium]|nr:hypothetical protein [Candidatus Uhrbacteria bacterium]